MGLLAVSALLRLCSSALACLQASVSTGRDPLQGTGSRTTSRRCLAQLQVITAGAAAQAGPVPDGVRHVPGVRAARRRVRRRHVLGCRAPRALPPAP